MRRVEVWLLPLLLCACQQKDAPPPVEETEAPAPAPSGLERAAIETGVVADASHISPVGLFSRRHEAGRDSLCLLPEPGKARHFRFGLETLFGSEEYCRGHGVARRAGDKLVLQFSSGQCVVVATYEGDRIALPGVVDMKCADLCQGRGSLEGVAFPRLGSDAATALNARDRDGNALCER